MRYISFKIVCLYTLTANIIKLNKTTKETKNGITIFRLSKKIVEMWFKLPFEILKASKIKMIMDMADYGIMNFQLSMELFKAYANITMAHLLA